MSSRYNSLPFSLLLQLLLPAFLLFLSPTSSLSFSNGVSHFPQPPQTSPLPSSGWELSEKQHDLGYLWGTKMSSVEGPDLQPVQFYSLVLAAERTRRKDPLDGFKTYTRGWNISERHYWASVGFTAVPLFAIAAVWRDYGNSQTAYTLSLIFLILFSIAAIAGCVVLYAGQNNLVISGWILVTGTFILCGTFLLLHNDNVSPFPCFPSKNNIRHVTTLDLNNATQVWASYVCQVSVNGICTTTGRLTPSFYSQMGNGVSMSIALHNYGPFLVELQDCTFARETFSQIYTKHCPALQRYSKWIYIGLAMVSTAVMLSLIFWVIYGRERRHRLYAKQSMADGRSGQDLELEKD
ncbi:hypothetical protein TIFTF001_014673 [Ficus carica]|uniref:Uncharacterized protein n=1 Tax=Ficus carica TaxID=3494 RepID=A0AA88A356_FICCA|nr:hypothetical protein TIFTF001_014673 [Ficus carica]